MKTCDLNELCAFLERPENRAIHLSYCFGNYILDSADKDRFVELLREFVEECNNTRDCADGYEMVYDVHSHEKYTYYVMREDGVTMVEIPILFLESSNSGAK